VLKDSRYSRMRLWFFSQSALSRARRCSSSAFFAAGCLLSFLGFLRLLPIFFGHLPAGFHQEAEPFPKNLAEVLGPRSQGTCADPPSAIALAATDGKAPAAGQPQKEVAQGDPAIQNEMTFLPPERSIATSMFSRSLTVNCPEPAKAPLPGLNDHEANPRPGD
jgi:hypothetical protein